MGSVIWSPAALVREEGTSTLRGGKFLLTFPEILLTNGPVPANFLSNCLTIMISNFRVNQFVYLLKFTSQVPIPAFIDIMSTEFFLKFFPILNILPDFLVINLFIRYQLLFGEALMQYKIE